MTAVIVSGHETGLQDSSLSILDRDDRTANLVPGHDEQPYVNVANGNLLIQQQDAFLPSLGDDYFLVRTYNARGRASDAQQHEDARWTFSTTVRLDVRNDGGTRYFEVEYGDGSFYDYQLDQTTGLYVSTDGDGAYEVIEDLGTNGNSEPSFLLTRANQSQYYFDSQGRLLQMVDTNGVTIDYVYESDRLIQVLDDQGHVLNYVYQSGQLFQVTDETSGVLVEYHYDSGRLSEVVDRFGHSTQYFYTSDGFLERIVLPSEQVVDGELETYDNREMNFVYDTVNWRGNNKATAKVVTQITDAGGGVTTFDYNFNLVTPGSDSNGVGHEVSNGKGHFKHGDTVTNTDGTTSEDKFFLGGTTTVVDALGNNRAYSNDQQYVDWRLAHGYYANYDATVAASDPNFQMQVDAIKGQHSLTYTYRDDGYLTEVVDQLGFHTTYAYDDKNNLISVTDRNGWGVTHSDSDYYRQLRAELGFSDAAGLGKQVAALTDSDIAALQEAFTTHLAYDERGNLIQTVDNADNQTQVTYTDFNKVASVFSPVGQAMISSDASYYQDIRVGLGYAALVSDLSLADIAAVTQLYTTYFEYDAHQNLIERRDAGGDITRFAYDSYGNQISRTVFLDANDLNDPAKQQVTTYAYDGFGNNISSTDAEGNQTFSEYDHFGNLTRYTDGNGGVTLYTYDADNRLLTVTDPEGHITVNTYDAVGNRISFTDANGHTITRLYDLNNNLIATLNLAETDALLDRVTQYEYDVLGNRTATVDAEGRRVEYTFNARRETVAITTPEVEDENGNPISYTSTLAYDGEGNRVTSTNYRGFTTELIYTPNNLVKQQASPNGQITRFEYDANNNAIAIIAGVQLPESKRQILQFSFDEEDQITSRTDAEGNLSKIAYDAAGNQIAVTDANGNTTTYEYDGNNRLLREILPQVTDPISGETKNYTIEHKFDGNGNEIETIDQNGHTTKFTFDRDNRLVLIEDANHIKTVFEYDSRHNRTAVLLGVDASADANGKISVSNVDQAQVTRFVYDEFSQVVAEIDAVGNALAESNADLYRALRTELGYAELAGNLSSADKQALQSLYTQRYIYDRVGNLVTTTDHLGRTSQFVFDAMDRVVTAQDALSQTAFYAYDGNGNLVKSTDELGRETHFVYDSMDREVAVTDAIRTVTQTEYDTFGNKSAETRAYGTPEARRSEYVYDLNNRVVQQLDPEGHAQSFEYDAVGNRIRVVDGRNNSTQFIYDALNRNIKVIDPLSFENVFEYDGVGNRVAIQDARGAIKRLEYDPGNRQIQATDAEGRITRFSYDQRGNRIELRTAAGTAEEELTQFVYDAENNLRRVIDAEGGITTNNYDRVYNRVETVDANGNAYVTEFDALNREIRSVDAEGQVTSYVLDAVGNILSQTDALQNVTRYEYDAVNRLIKQVAADLVETHFAYDAVGNSTSVTNAANTAAAATTLFEYNLDDKLVAQTDAEGNRISYEYDANHNRTSVIDANLNATLYEYDENNRVARIEDPEGNVVQYIYDGNGNRVQVIDGRNSVSTIYYNANNETIVSVDAEGFATTNVYDNNGNIVSQTLHMQSLATPLDPNVLPAVPTGAADQTTTFEYDKLNRASARIDAEGYRTEYVYDAVGNRLQTLQYRDLAGTDIAVTHSFYDKVYRETTRVSAEGYLTQFTYDAVGNRISRTVYDQRVGIPGAGEPIPQAGDTGRTEQYRYDSVYRLTETESALGVTTRYEYDSRGNRTAVVLAAGTPDASRTDYEFDRANRMIATRDALGTETRVTLDANGNEIERREAVGTAEERQTLMTYDKNNRLVTETNALGIVTRTHYDANGNIVAITRAEGLPEARTETRTYDKNNRLTASMNGEGERVEQSYDGAGNSVRIVAAPGLPEQRTSAFEYDRDNRQTARIDGEGVRTEYRYDGAANQIETIEAAGIAAEERHHYQVYDLDNRITATIDPLGGITSYEYDVLGNAVSVTDANGGVQQNSFDAIGRRISSLSAGGTLMQYSYDRRDNLLSRATSFADGSDLRTSTYSYDLLDRQIASTDGNGFTTTAIYDVFGNQTEVTRGQYLLSSNDPNYDPDKAAVAHSETTVSRFDAADRLVQSVDAQGTETHFEYDAVGNRTALINAANVSGDRRTSYRYDLANRLVEVINPVGGITRNEYNALGDVVQRSQLQSDDGAGNQVWIHTQFAYDNNGRLLAEVDGEGFQTHYQYDAVGNQLATITAAGTPAESRTSQQYDLNNQLIAEIDGENNRTDFAYDAMGNRIRATDARGGVSHFYFDADNRLVNLLDAAGYLTDIKYDSLGNQIAKTQYFQAYSGSVDDFVPPMASVSAEDRTTTYQYDRLSQLVEQVDADAGVYRFAYDAVGNRVSATDALNRETRYVYDLNNQLVVQIAADGVETQYVYDQSGNQIEITRAAGTADAATVQRQYDLNNRLIQRTDALNNTVLTSVYDLANNQIRETDSNGNNTFFDYDLNNRTTQVTDGEGNSTRYSYDGRGNQITLEDGRGNVETRFYDLNNRLTHVVDREGYVTLN